MKLLFAVPAGLTASAVNATIGTRSAKCDAFWVVPPWPLVFASIAFHEQRRRLTCTFNLAYARALVAVGKRVSRPAMPSKTRALDCFTGSTDSPCKENTTVVVPRLAYAWG